MKPIAVNEEQLQKIKTDPGFVAALDQSGGSTPKALSLYGIQENTWSSDEEMFTIVHQMRTRIMTSPAFNGERVIGAILFENTMEREIEGQPTADYLWNVKRVVPFLKVDKGVVAEKDGVQLMKPMPTLGALLETAKANRIFGTKMRSVVKQANDAGIKDIVVQQFEIGQQIISARSSSRKLIFAARKKRKRSSYSKQPSSKTSTNCQLVSSSCSSLRCRNRTTFTPTLSNIRRL
jgi:fructose-bisphosphate aldolase, class I